MASLFLPILHSFCGCNLQLEYILELEVIMTATIELCYCAVSIPKMSFVQNNFSLKCVYKSICTTD